MKTLQSNLLISTLALLASVANGSAASVEPGLCTKTVSADEFSTQLEKFPALVSTVKSLDTFLAATIPMQLDIITICETDADLSVVLPDVKLDPLALPQDVSQVAYRDGAEVILSMPKFNGLDPQTQALLFLHEIGHSYISMDTPNRMIKLRNIINLIGSAQDHTVTPQQFAQVERDNDFGVFAPAGYLQFQNEYATLLNPKTALLEKAAAASKITKSWTSVPPQGYLPPYRYDHYVGGALANYFQFVFDDFISQATKDLLAGDQQAVAADLDAGLPQQFVLSSISDKNVGLLKYLGSRQDLDINQDLSVGLADPFCYSAQFDHSIVYLLNHSHLFSDKEAEGQGNILFQAIADQKASVVQALLANPRVDLSVKMEGGEECVKGIYVNETCSKNYSVLAFAKAASTPEIVGMLKAHGAK